MKAAPPTRRKFTPQEDIALKYYTDEIGTNNWQEIAKRMPNRNAKQCRDRYNNYLMENHICGPWTPAEDSLIISKYLEIGAKWVEISKYIHGRSGNDVKNRWYKHLVRRASIQEELKQRKEAKEESHTSGISPPNERVNDAKWIYSLENLLARPNQS